MDIDLTESAIEQLNRALHQLNGCSFYPAKVSPFVVAKEEEKSVSDKFDELGKRLIDGYMEGWNQMESLIRQLSDCAMIIPEIKKVIFSNPYTIVMWNDTITPKTVVKCMDGDEFDEFHGLAACIAKRYFETMNQMKKTIQNAERPQEKKKKKSGTFVWGTDSKKTPHCTVVWKLWEQGYSDSAIADALNTEIEEVRLLKCGWMGDNLTEHRTQSQIRMSQQFRRKATVDDVFRLYNASKSIFEIVDELHIPDATVRRILAMR